MSFFDFLSLPKSIIKNRNLLAMLVKRNIELRYKGSVLGLVWSFAHPLLMMSVYAYVFGYIFKAKWPGVLGEKPFAFPVIMLCGMATFSIFQESVTLSCNCILNNVNYVKKVIFPLELLPLSVVISTFILDLAWFVLLLIGAVVLLGELSWTMLLMPLILFPLILFTLGASYFSASMCVYLRDMPYLVGVVCQILFFLTPIFYSLSAIGSGIAYKLLCASPLAYLVEAGRSVFLYGTIPSLSQYLLVLFECLIVCHFGYYWFEKTKGGFADVI